MNEINDQLKDATAGIVCLTQDNKSSPWILFESGALAKGVATNRVCTFLIDLQPNDLDGPLSHFNHTLPDKNSIWELLRTLNNSLSEHAIKEAVLRRVFDTNWPSFQAGFGNALTGNPSIKKSRKKSVEDSLDVVTEGIRKIYVKLHQLEPRIPLEADWYQRARFKASPNLSKRGEPPIEILFEELFQMGLSDQEVIERLATKGWGESYVREQLAVAREREGFQKALHHQSQG